MGRRSGRLWPGRRRRERKKSGEKRGDTRTRHKLEGSLNVSGEEGRKERSSSLKEKELRASVPVTRIRRGGRGVDSGEQRRGWRGESISRNVWKGIRDGALFRIERYHSIRVLERNQRSWVNISWCSNSATVVVRIAG